MAELRKYDNKVYDFDIYKKLAIEGYDNWVDSYNISSTKKEKVRQAMMDILQHMTDDNGSYADLNRIYFSTDYANTKGLFGKKATDSKHYKNAVAYLLKVFGDSTPYEEPKPEAPTRTKASRQWLGLTVLGHLGNISGYTTDEIRSKELLRALLSTLDQLKTGDYDYEDLYGNEVLDKWLGDAITAVKTTDNLDDDNIFWGRVGLTNPFKVTKKIEEKKNDSAEDSFLLFYLLNGGTREAYEQRWKNNIYNGLTPADYAMLKMLNLLDNDDAISKIKSYYTGEDNVRLPNNEKLSIKNYNKYTKQQLDQLDAELVNAFSKATSDGGYEWHEDLRARRYDTTQGTYMIIGAVPIILKDGKNYVYAYCKEDRAKKDGKDDTNKMVLLNLTGTNNNNVLRSQKGGKLLTLRNNIYG